MIFRHQSLQHVYLTQIYASFYLFQYVFQRGSPKKIRVLVRQRLRQTETAECLGQFSQRDLLGKYFCAQVIEPKLMKMNCKPSVPIVLVCFFFSEGTIRQKLKQMLSQNMQLEIVQFIGSIISEKLRPFGPMQLFCMCTKQTSASARIKQLLSSPLQDATQIHSMAQYDIIS